MHFKVIERQVNEEDYGEESDSLITEIDMSEDNDENEDLLIHNNLVKDK